VSRVTASASLDYEHRLGANHWNAFVDVTEQLTGARNTDFSPTAPDGSANSVFRTMPNAWRTDLQFGLASEHLRVSFYVDNLFDRRNVISLTPSSFSGGGNGDLLLVDRPRTVGLWLRAGL
jgi:outer membrane receptor protein involved in Fe transport